MIKIIAISDTHTMHKQIDIPHGDILIHAGDFSHTGQLTEVSSFLDWFYAQPHKHKIFICGNHEKGVQNNPTTKHLITAKSNHPKNVHYLENESITLEGINFHGFPYTPTFFNWAFMKDDESDDMIKAVNKIPDNTDILINHGGIYQYVDKVQTGKHVGSKSLRKRVKQIKPKYVICGHIHEAYGTDHDGKTKYINASICTLNYKPTNKPQVINYG